MQPILLFADNAGPLTGAGNNTWLIDGREPTLVDAGIGAATHLDAVARALDGRPLHRVLVTHGHRDHAGGMDAIRARWAGVEACKWLGGDFPSWHRLRDGERIAAGDEWLTSMHTPGHAPDHVCFWHAETRSVFGGDLVIPGTTVMIPAGRGGNLKQYLASLRRVAALNPARLYPGHGPVVEQPPDLIAEYLAHRALRERQIVACLAGGVQDPEEIVDRVYPALDPRLRPAARMTVEAHLEKLREDAQTGGGESPAVAP
jgi:glyoxylase-like metal-dependent hydrolase (beta-lactamase superfamily II)